jgi:3-hydroxybutyryl-CoA dehydrogenase
MMGTQIAAYLLQSGHSVILKTRFQENLAAIVANLRKKLSKNLNEQGLERCLENLIVTTEYFDLKNADVVIEASIENVKVKQEIFSNLSAVCEPTTIFATNSSSLSIDELAAATDRPDRFIGLHMFNPIHRMDLVEVIRGTNTSDETTAFTVAFAKELKKQPVVVKNSPGFVVNRLLLPQINDAIYLLGEGIASKEDIDSAVKLGLNHPMGPFELADLIGLDTCLSILNTMHAGLVDARFEPAPLLRTMVGQGKLGRKSGQGFYTYG